MIKLPQITLCAFGSEKYREAQQKALDFSCQDIEWGAVKNIIQECPSIDDWNYRIIYELHKHIDTEFALLVHPDGYVINPEMWDNEWLGLDYIGAPWPLPQDDYSYRDEEGNIQRVGNSVSLRSKKLMQAVATRPWRFYYGNCNEDGFICCHNRKWLESKGYRFATFEQALRFGKEHELPENEGLSTFTFHQV